MRKSLRVTHCRSQVIALLNGLFRGRKDIRDLHYNKHEHVGDTQEIGSVIFDLTCTDRDGTQFIVEVQRSYHKNLIERMVYYGCKLVTEQRPLGNKVRWGYGVGEVYVVVLMDGFRVPGLGLKGQYLHDICLCDRNTTKIYYEGFGFILVELLNFELKGKEPQGELEGWLYVLKNMSKMKKIPTFLRKPVFQKLFEIAEYAKMDKKEKEMYDLSLKRKWDENVVLDQAREEGKAEGKAEGITEGITKGIEQQNHKIITKLLKDGFDDAKIASLTDSDLGLVQAIRAALDLKPKEGV